MIEISALSTRTLMIGRLGENEHRRVAFDVTDYLGMYPNATFTLLHMLPGATTAYPVPTVVEGTTLYWPVTDSDLTVEGLGKCELIVMEGGVIAKSAIYQTKILSALDGSGEVPDPWETWQEVFAGIKNDAEVAARDAAAAQTGAETAQGKAEDAQAAAERAQGLAEDAQGAAERAQTGAEDARDNSIAQALKAEGFAVGEQDGTPVGSGTYFENNAKYYCELAGQHAEASGWTFFDIDESTGEMLVTVTDGIEDEVTFAINENTGELEVTVA